MDGWGKIAAGVALGIAGTVYATNRKVREKLPDAARDLPDGVKRRFESAVNAAREASANRREEIMRDLSRHQAEHPPAHPVRPNPAAPGSDFAVGKDATGGIVDGGVANDTAPRRPVEDITENTGEAKK